MNYKTAILKKKLELLFMSPFVLAGKIAGKMFPLKTKHRHFLFFPSGDVGGSIKVNADILSILKKEKPLVVFSKKPKNNRFYSLFEQEGVRILDLHQYIDVKWYHFLNFFYRGVLAAWINAAKDPIIFGGEAIFFYKIVPHVKSETRVIDLCHLNTWFNYSIAFVNKIDKRILSTPQVKRDLEATYLRTGVPKQYFDRLMFIDNKIDLPSRFSPTNNKTLQVLFVGRGAPQKRVYLIVEIAKTLHQEKRDIHFSFVGDVEQIVPEDVQKYCTMYGIVKEEQKLNEIYTQSDVLILTSAYEGLPIVVMDMMARGRIVLSTSVDGIPDYINDKQNGLLIKSKEEKQIVTDAVAQLIWLLNNPDEKNRIAKNAFDFAQSHFSKEVFDEAYSSILL